MSAPAVGGVSVPHGDGSTVVRLRRKEAPTGEFRERFEPVPHEASPSSLELDPRSPEKAELADS